MNSQTILIIDSRDCPGVANAFRTKFERQGCDVVVTSDDADANTDVIRLLQSQQFDLILFFCSEAYAWDDARWVVPPFDWSILSSKKSSINAETPVIAVATAPDAETLSRFQEAGVMHVIDRGDKPTAAELLSLSLQQLKREEAVAR